MGGGGLGNACMLCTGVVWAWGVGGCGWAGGLRVEDAPHAHGFVWGATRIAHALLVCGVPSGGVFEQRFCGRPKLAGIWSSSLGTKNLAVRGTNKMGNMAGCWYLLEARLAC